VTVAQANEGNVFYGRELFFDVLLSDDGDARRAEVVFPPVWSKCQCVFTSRVTGRIVVLKIASFSSLILEASPLSINSVLPSSTIAVTFPPSPEKMYNPWLSEVIVRGLSSNCSVAFWMTVSPVLACPIACEAGPIIITTRTTICVRTNKGGLFRSIILATPLSKL
jgi:hypothetical protein